MSVIATTENLDFTVIDQSEFELNPSDPESFKPKVLYKNEAALSTPESRRQTISLNKLGMLPKQFRKALNAISAWPEEVSVAKYRVFFQTYFNNESIIIGQITVQLDNSNTKDIRITLVFTK